MKTTTYNTNEQRDWNKHIIRHQRTKYNINVDDEHDNILLQSRRISDHIVKQKHNQQQRIFSIIFTYKNETIDN